MRLFSEKLDDLIPSDTRYNFIRDCIGNFYGGIFEGCYIPFIAIVGRKYFHLSPFQLSLLAAGIFVTGILGMLVSSAVPVNREHRYLALMGFVGAAFLIFLSPFVRYSQGSLYTFMCMAFFVCASYGPLYQVIIERIYRPEIRSKLLGYAKSLLALASVICTALASMVIDINIRGFDVWRICFVIGGLATACSMYFCFWKFRMPFCGEKKENPLRFLGESFSLLWEDRTNTGVIIVGVFFTCAYMLINTLVPIYQNDILGIGPKEVTYLMLIQSVSWVFGYRIFGDYMHDNGAVKGLILTCAMGIIMAGGYILCGKNWLFLTVFYVPFGLFMAGEDIAWMNVLFYLSGGRKVTQYQSLNYFFISVRAIIGIIVATNIINYAEKININYKYIFGLAFVFFAVAIMMLFCLFRKKSGDKWTR